MISLLWQLCVLMLLCSPGFLTANGPIGYAIGTVPGDLLCRWRSPPGSEPIPNTVLDPAGGTFRAYYQRGENYKALDCPQYYAHIQAWYVSRKAERKKNPGLYPRFDDAIVWQCWHDDPCACEQDRS